MEKRKRIIYYITFIIFFLLIFLYGKTTASSDKKVNEERLESTVSVSESSMEKHIEYQAKMMALQFSSADLGEAQSLEEAEQLLTTDAFSELDYYLMDQRGVLNKQGGVLHGKPVEKQALQMADGNGYTIVGLMDFDNNIHYVTLIVPVSDEWGGYLVAAYTGDDFVKMVSENITISKEYLTLFDEWGNVIGTCAPQDGDPTILESIKKGITVFDYKNSRASFQEQKQPLQYNVYFKAGEPLGWSYGTRVDRISNGDEYILRMPASSLFMFCILLLILAVILILDIINERETKQKLADVSTIDHLTGLTNAAGMQEVMERFMQGKTLKGYCFVCMDIVAFSRINTMFGYTTGDTLLRIIADVIKERYYCGIHTNADCFVFWARNEEGLTKKIEEYFKDAVELRLGREYLQMLNFKFGVFPVEEKCETFRQAYEGALMALKDAKKNAGKSEVVYDSDLQQNMETRKNIEINMMHALSKEEFEVYIQPQINLPDESCNRGEALIRWNSEFMGFMPPDKFIPIFESNGFVVETDFFMLASVMEMLAARLESGLAPVTVAVNQSKVTITFPNYYERLKLLIERFPTVPLKYVELEVTESTLEDNWGIIVPLVHSIKKLGFSVAMDDFGSGFSSLNSLRILPIDILKIDKGFLGECERSARCRIIIKNVIHMAKELDIKLVCEGVENQMQLDFLKENDCDIAQGYLYSRPIPMDEFLKKFCKD